VESRPIPVDLLQRYDRPTQDVLPELLLLAGRIGKDGLEHIRPDERLILLEQVNRVAERLRKEAPLTISKMCFCREVKAFGVYDELSSNYQFLAGSDGRPGERVRVYVEVRNFDNNVRGGVYETVLSSRLEIRDEEGKKVVEIKPATSPDRSLTPRQDYYITFEFHVPPQLPPGRLYTLWVHLRDDTTQGEGGPPRVAHRWLDFHVTGGAVRPGRTAEP
jgi:hypothetical protein